MMRVLAIIPARGGSKRVPGKNTRDVGGRPLIAWTIEAALGCAIIDRVIVSTDYREIADVAKSFGAEIPFMRPPDLASDDATSADVVAHALQHFSSIGETYDVGVLLQPTSPLRCSDDISTALALLADTKIDSCVAVGPVSHQPWWCYKVTHDGRMTPMATDQTASASSATVMLNGAIFAFRTEWFLAHRVFMDDETRAIVMPEERSIDIDTEFQLRLCHAILAESQ